MSTLELERDEVRALAELLSIEFERDARRFDRDFSEENEV